MSTDIMRRYPYYSTVWSINSDAKSKFSLTCAILTFFDFITTSGTRIKFI
jgi:hypothetical protein